MELKVPFFNVTLPLGVPSATLADALLDKVHFIVNSTPEVTIRPDEPAGLKTAVWPLPTVTPSQVARRNGLIIPESTLLPSEL